MGTKLPVLARTDFEEEILAVAGSIYGIPDENAILKPSVLEALWIHYQELLRWNPRLSLIGPGTAEDLISRHYGESLAALPHLPETGSLLDAGSGGGFPGFVLAVSRPLFEVTLLEPKQRKWSFLNSVIRKVKAAGIELSCRALDARVESPLPASPALPQQIDIVTCRALALGRERLEELTRSYPGVRFLLWTSDPRTGDSRTSDPWTHGPQSDPPSQEYSSQKVKNPGPVDSWPPSYRVARRIHLPGSQRRVILDLTSISE